MRESALAWIKSIWVIMCESLEKKCLCLDGGVLAPSAGVPTLRRGVRAT